MNLTIDAGNTFTKAVIFDEDRIQWMRTYKNFSVNDLIRLKQVSSGSVNASILSSVAKTDKKIIRFLQSHSIFVELNSKTKLPIKNKYKTPGTLGSDRLASVAGAAKLFPGKNILVIDAGTCIKYDFITAKKEYLGGSISPGLLMRFQALHNLTDRLPLIQPGTIQGFIGTSTKDSILTGVQEGISHEINGFIHAYKKKFRDVKVIMSGGDSALFAGHIKSSIFAAPNLIHTGLHEILKQNVEQT
jgi:type III pantothenate kinase